MSRRILPAISRLVSSTMVTRGSNEVGFSGRAFHSPAIHTTFSPLVKTTYPHHHLMQRRGMFVQTQPTPNENSLMFLPGKKVMESGSFDFPDARSSLVSPLATKLFGMDGVAHVFFGTDFITVTKQDDTDWGVLKPGIFAIIMDHYAADTPLFTDRANAVSSNAANTDIHEDDDEVVAMIKELLETRIRPAVQEDGGDIVFKTFEPDTGIVFLKLVGACRGCSSSSVTLKSGIENMLKHYIPEVSEVREAEAEEDEKEGIKAFNEMEKHLSN